MNNEPYQAKSNLEEPVTEEERNEENNKKLAKVGAKAAANYFTGGKGGQIVDLVANTKIGDKILDNGSKAISRLTKASPVGDHLQKGINLAGESGITSAVDKGMDLKSPSGGLGNIADSSLTDELGGTQGKTDLLGGLIGGKGKKDLAKSVIKLIPKPALIAIIAGSAFFALIIFILLSGPNSGAFLDLTSKIEGIKSNIGNVINGNIGYTIEQIESKLIYVGDSNIEGLKSDISNQNIRFLGDSNSDYNWFINTGQIDLESILNDNDNKIVVFNLGINDLDNKDKYVNVYNSLIAKYPNTKFYFMSITSDSEVSAAQNNINDFNQLLASTYNNKYIDTVTGINNESNINTQIHNKITSYIQSDTQLKGIEILDNYPTVNQTKGLNGTSIKDALGPSGIDLLNNYIISSVNSSEKCSGNAVASAAASLIQGLAVSGYHIPYYYGGGHGSTVIGVNENWGANTTPVKTKNHTYNYSGLDCSGFISWAMNQAGVTGNKVASAYISSGPNLIFSQAKPGDVVGNDGHIVMVIENQNNYLLTAEATVSGVQFKKYSQADVDTFQYKITSMGAFYANNCQI